MRIHLKNFLLLSALTAILTVLPTLVHAQLGDPGCDPLDPACPIDGGLSFLLAAGVGYGVKKVRDARKKLKPAPQV
ncbi:MAG: hypothetical protein ABI863_10960 [Ginsengibacter sp.]